jgi:hypothetical protein
MSVRLLALYASHPLPTGIFLILISVRDWVNLRIIVQLEGLGQLKKSTSPHWESKPWTFGLQHSARDYDTMLPITSCSLLKISRRFRGSCRLHLQGQTISKARNKCESKWQAELKRWLNFNGLHGAVSQKIKFFITMAVRTSNPCIS